MVNNPPDRTATPLGLWKGGVAVLFALVLTLIGSTRAQGQETDDVVVQLQPGANAHKVAADYNTTLIRHIAGTNTYSLQVPAGSDDAAFVAELQQDSRIASAESDFPIENSEVDGSQLHFAFDAGNQPGAYMDQTAYQQIHLGAAQSTTTGKGVRVAILDTGVFAQHVALRDHLVKGYNALNPGASPDDAPDGSTNAAVGHGTMIAGLVAYIAPGAGIMPVRVLNGDGVGTLFSVIAGIHYAVAHGAQVINMSFGTTQQSDALEAAVEKANQAGVVIVASAGNDGARTHRYPAALDNVLAVASVEANNVKSDYSNYGEYIGVVAPGTGIRSTYWTGGYANWSGTSFAAPFVTATAALVFAVHPQYTASQVIRQIRGTAHSVTHWNPQYEEQLGAGIIDVERAVTGNGQDGEEDD